MMVQKEEPKPRGICTICGKEVLHHENFAVIFEGIPPRQTVGIAHEECLDQWQRPNMEQKDGKG